MAACGGSKTFMVVWRKPRVEAPEEAILVAGTEEYEVPGFINASELQEGDEIMIAWSLVSRLETKRVKVIK
jgi:hypothetical protein